MLPSLAGLALHGGDAKTEVVKRNNDGTFTFSPEDLRILRSFKNEEEVPLPLRDAWRFLNPSQKRAKVAKYPMPTLVQDKQGLSPAVYLLPTDELKKLFVRHDAVKIISRVVNERLPEPQAQEEEAILAVLRPLDEEWKKVETFWEKNGIKGMDSGAVSFVIREEEGDEKLFERFGDTFERILGDYAAETFIEVNGLNVKLNQFVEAMMN